MSKKRRKNEQACSRRAAARQARQPTPSPLKIPKASERLLLRITVYQGSAGLLFGLLFFPLMIHWREAAARFEQIPTPIQVAILTAAALPTAYRLFHAATRNRKLRDIAADEAKLARYATEQSVSTLISLLVFASLAFYLSSLLDPIAARVSTWLSGISPGFIDAAIAVLATLFWGVLTNALWDLIKWWFSRKTASKR